MFCRFCGKQIIEDSVFCPYCGKSLDEKEKTTTSVKKEIPVIQTSSTDNSADYEHYKKRANNIASYSLQKVTKIICYIALAVFLIFNIKMAPMYGWAKFFFYVGAAAIAIGLIVLFNKKVLTCDSKRQFIVCFCLALFIIMSSIGLRIVYESKVDYVENQIPANGQILVSLSKKTQYYNSTGTGVIRNPSTNIKIGEKWYDSGDTIPVELNKSYSLRVGAGGSGIGGYTDGSITFSKNSFSNGKYQLSKSVYFSGVTASMAEVNLTFTRFCTFWEVVLY